MFNMQIQSILLGNYRRRGETRAEGPTTASRAESKPVLCRSPGDLKKMLYLSEVLMQNPQVENFEQLVAVVKERSKSEMFFRIDVKPQFEDTPSNWEDRLEAAFT